MNDGAFLQVRAGEQATRLRRVNAQAGGLLVEETVDDVDLVLDWFERRERLAEIGRYGFSLRLRTLDALQLALAMDLAAQDLMDSFVVSDRLLGEVAALEGLSVINPETE